MPIHGVANDLAGSGTMSENRLSMEDVAVMLIRGEFPDNYDEIVREISDDDFERLWQIFDEKRSSAPKASQNVLEHRPLRLITTRRYLKAEE
jgi:hypothetical protein